MDPSPAGPQASPRARALGTLFHPRVCLALLILATLFARHGALSTPSGRVRSTLTAMITRNLSRDLDEIGPRAIFYPRIDYAGDQPGYLLQEFPIVNLAGVLLEKSLGLERETAYRLPSLLLFAAMLALLYAFVRARFGALEALATTLLVSLLPLAVYQSMEVMPEQGVATAFLAGLWFFDRHLDEGRTRPLAASVLCFSVMLLIKSTSGLLLLVPLGLFWSRRGSPLGLLRPRYLVAALACALPLVVWLVHAWRVNRTSTVDDGRTMSTLIDNYLAQHERWAQLTSGTTYAGTWDMLVAAYLRWPVLLCVAGSVYGLVRCRGDRALLACWLVSFALFFVALPFNLSTHWYYTHGYAPLIALGAALAVAAVLRPLLARVPERGRPALQVLLAAGALVWVLRANWNYVPPFDPDKHAFGEALQAVLPPRALGIVSSEEPGVWDGELFYASDTRGWRANTRKGLSRRPISEEFVEERRRKGATFLAHFGPPEKLEERIPELFRRLTEEQAVLLRGPEWIVFSLEPANR